MLQANLTTFVVLLVVASAVAILVKAVPVPYEVALAVVGLVAGSLAAPIPFQLTPTVILAAFLPGLLFEAAYRLDWRLLRRNLVAVIALATVGVLLTSLLVGGLVHLLLGLGLPIAFLIGTMLAPTDPVAVLAVFRRLGLPERLTNLVEAESLANDGTGLVLFSLALAFMTTAGSGLDLAESFLRLVLGGLGLGALIGFAASLLISRVDDFTVEMTVTAIAAYGGYLLADSLQFSGILAVVAAAVIMGNYGRRHGMSDETRQAVDLSWEYVAFLLNSLLFLLIGLAVALPQLLAAAGLVLAVAAIALFARAAAVYAVLSLLRPLGQSVPLRWQHLLVWGGLRGAIAVALVLSLQGRGGRYALVETLVYGAALLSLLIQGLSIGPLARRLLSQPEALA
ncbi:MAG: cation:proton antiporter [Candidatus Dormibacteraeota bacterium]|nr:cation:proton antiporter [Candidatus Dormibacteraeota bacterium]